MSVALPSPVTPAHPDYEREVYSVAQAAAYLCVHVSRIYADAAARRIGCRRDGRRRLRFSQGDLDRWRQARRVEPRDAVTSSAPVRVARRQPSTGGQLADFLPRERVFQD